VSLPIPSPATSVSAARVPLNIEESIFPLVYMSAASIAGSSSPAVRLGAAASVAEAQLYMGVIDCSGADDVPIERKEIVGDDYTNELERELTDLKEKTNILASRLQKASRKVEATRYGTAAMHDKLAAIRLALVSRRTAKRIYTAAELERQPVHSVNVWKKNSSDLTPPPVPAAATPKQTRAGKRRNSFSKTSPAEPSPETADTTPAEAATKKKKRRRI